MRRSRTILQWDDPNDKKVNIRNADLNFLVLKPLVKRLRDDSGDVGMHALSGIMGQLLGQSLVQVHFRRGLLFHICFHSLTPLQAYNFITNKSDINRGCKSSYRCIVGFMVILFICSLPILRMKLFFGILDKPLPKKADLKSDAKKIKSLLVLVKQKLSRQQVCRSQNFRRLMAMVFDPEEKERG